MNTEFKIEKWLDFLKKEISFQFHKEMCTENHKNEKQSYGFKNKLT